MVPFLINRKYTNVIDFFIGYFDKNKITSSIHKQVILYLISGGICFVVDMTILVFLVEILKINVIISNSISVLISIYVAYLLNVKFIFQAGKFGLKKEISLFFIFSGISFFLNMFFLYMLVEIVLMWYVIAKLITTVIVAIFNFTTRKWLIFSK